MYFLALVVTVTFVYVLVPIWTTGKVSSALPVATLPPANSTAPSRKYLILPLVCRKILFAFIARFFPKLKQYTGTCSAEVHELCHGRAGTARHQFPFRKRIRGEWSSPLLCARF